MFVSNTDDPIYTFLFHTGFHSHGLISCVLLNPIKHKVLYNEFFVKITHVWICAVMKISMSVIQNFSAQQSSMVMFPRTKRWPNTMQSDYYISRFIYIYVYIYIWPNCSSWCRIVDSLDSPWMRESVSVIYWKSMQKPFLGF